MRNTDAAWHHQGMPGLRSGACPGPSAGPPPILSWHSPMLGGVPWRLRGSMPPCANNRGASEHPEPLRPTERCSHRSAQRGGNLWPRPARRRTQGGPSGAAPPPLARLATLRPGHPRRPSRTARTPRRAARWTSRRCPGRTEPRPARLASCAGAQCPMPDRPARERSNCRPARWHFPSARRDAGTARLARRGARPAATALQALPAYSDLPPRGELAWGAQPPADEASAAYGYRAGGTGPGGLRSVVQPHAATAENLGARRSSLPASAPERGARRCRHNMRRKTRRHRARRQVNRQHPAAPEQSSLPGTHQLGATGALPAIAKLSTLVRHGCNLDRL